MLIALAELCTQSPALSAEDAIALLRNIVGKSEFYYLAVSGLGLYIGVELIN
jgi:hypothetical protein